MCQTFGKHFLFIYLFIYFLLTTLLVQKIQNLIKRTFLFVLVYVLTYTKNVYIRETSAIQDALHVCVSLID